MKRLLIVWLIICGAYALLGFKTNQGKTALAKTIYGIWVENGNVSNAETISQFSFYPGGKISILRSLHNYVGYFKIKEQRPGNLSGVMTVGQRFPFTAIFIKPDEIRLTINYEDRTQTHLLKKVKEVKSGFQFIEALKN